MLWPNIIKKPNIVLILIIAKSLLNYIIINTERWLNIALFLIAILSKSDFFYITPFFSYINPNYLQNRLFKLVLIIHNFIIPKFHSFADSKQKSIISYFNT